MPCRSRNLLAQARLPLQHTSPGCKPRRLQTPFLPLHTGTEHYVCLWEMTHLWFGWDPFCRVMRVRSNGARSSFDRSPEGGWEGWVKTFPGPNSRTNYSGLISQHILINYARIEVSLLCLNMCRGCRHWFFRGKRTQARETLPSSPARYASEECLQRKFFVPTGLIEVCLFTKADRLAQTDRLYMLSSPGCLGKTFISLVLFHILLQYNHEIQRILDEVAAVVHGC